VASRSRPGWGGLPPPGRRFGGIVRRDRGIWVPAEALGGNCFAKGVGVTFRRGRLPVAAFDPLTSRWAAVDAGGDVAGTELSLATFNVWFNEYFADQRYRAIADVLAHAVPDVMVFQEVTPDALAVFLAQPWIRVRYRCASVIGGDLGNYGMLVLSRLPVSRVTYTRLPTRLARGFLTVELTVNGQEETVTALHLESGKAAARLRARQLGRVFRALNRADSAVVLGDFNMRDDENGRIDADYIDVWPALRPTEPGFTEDTDINLMRLDSKNKHRQVRFDRVLLKGSRWRPAAIELLGTDPISDAHPRVFPSDHFGVLCRLELRTPVHVEPTTRPPRRRLIPRFPGTRAT
jgi:tyrosyl-DNA phosphodiesterase 2